MMRALGLAFIVGILKYIVVGVWEGYFFSILWMNWVYCAVDKIHVFFVIIYLVCKG